MILNLNQILKILKSVYRNILFKIVLHSPCFKYFERLAGVQHSWGRENYHWSWPVGHFFLKSFDIFEVEGISLHKCILDFLIGPVHEKF